MGFSKTIKEDILVLSARHCCVCHKSAGLNIEVHHIKPQQQHGSDCIENAIALCLDCHADAGHYFAGHPKGSKLSPTELQKHKDSWFKNVKDNKISSPTEACIELTVENQNINGRFAPIFIREKTKFIDRDNYKNLFKIIGIDPMDFVNEQKNLINDSISSRDPHLNKVKNYDDYLDYLNGVHIKPDDQLSITNPQPILHYFHSLPRYGSYKEINLSNCVLNLKLKNNGLKVLENYKLYLSFENVIEVDCVSKRNSVFDNNDYKYNTHFFKKFRCEFVPEKDVLVQNDSIFIDELCFISNPLKKEVCIKWEMFARNIQTSGILKIDIDPKFETIERDKFVSNADQYKTTIRILPKLKLDN